MELLIIATALVLISGMRQRHFRQLGKGRGQALELEWGVPARVLTAAVGSLAGAGGRQIQAQLKAPSSSWLFIFGSARAQKGAQSPKQRKAPGTPQSRRAPTPQETSFEIDGDGDANHKMRISIHWF